MSSAILTELFPDQTEPVARAYAVALARIPGGSGKTSGIALGEQIGSECLAMRAGDGTGAPNTHRPRTDPGGYVPTTLAVSQEWSNVKPFVIDDRARFRPGPPPALASAEWARDYNEIRLVGARQSANRTGEQTGVARFWSVTGVPSWNPVVRLLATSARPGVLDNARLFALVNMAAADAFIAVFDAKYAYNL